MEKARKSVTFSSFASSYCLKKAAAQPAVKHGRFPFVAGADIGQRQRREPLRGVENAREIFRALDVARQPEKIVGGAGEHALDHRPHPSRTHVSLVPPPWLELTTSEPAFIATRVKPPGTMRTPSVPVSTKGRRST